MSFTFPDLEWLRRVLTLSPISTLFSDHGKCHQDLPLGGIGGVEHLVYTLGLFNIAMV